ncbi:hypothetical protein NDU88_000873 [Pleurodeles waltl]|uniref:Uncharacterized protein n=1 Tax=Pleurodeles waltl TaxID=8319 RepID=A0AAV7THI7_PLEWA|nr:hypothetical protein NDU88_000873 [Pleurodeles waltl]
MCPPSALGLQKELQMLARPPSDGDFERRSDWEGAHWIRLVQTLKVSTDLQFIPEFARGKVQSSLPPLWALLHLGLITVLDAADLGALLGVYHENVFL